MENLKDLISSFNERIRSPFYNTFIVCWLIINWHIVFITFGNSYTVEQKLKLIDLQLSNYSLSIGWPIIVALVFFLFYRWIEVLASLYQTWQKKIKEDNEMKQLGLHTVSGSEYLDLAKKLENLNGEYTKLRGIKAKLESEVIQEIDKGSEMNNVIKSLNQKLLDKPDYAKKENIIGEWVVRFKNSEIKRNGFDLNIVQNGANLEFVRQEGNNGTSLGFVLCYENLVEHIGFALSSRNTIELFIHGAFQVINKDNEGHFNHLKGWLKSNNEVYNSDEVFFYRKSYYSHLKSLDSIE